MFGFRPRKGTLTDADQQRISEILGSTMTPVSGDPVVQYLKTKAKAKKKPLKRKKRNAKSN